MLKGRNASLLTLPWCRCAPCRTTTCGYGKSGSQCACDAVGAPKSTCARHFCMYDQDTDWGWYCQFQQIAWLQREARTAQTQCDQRKWRAATFQCSKLASGLTGESPVWMVVSSSRLWI